MASNLNTQTMSVCVWDITYKNTLIYHISEVFFDALTSSDGVVCPIEPRPVKIVTVVLIPSTQSSFKVTWQSWTKKQTNIFRAQMLACVIQYQYVNIHESHLLVKMGKIQHNSSWSERSSLWSWRMDTVWLREPQMPAENKRSEWIYYFQKFHTSTSSLS